MAELLTRDEERTLGLAVQAGLKAQAELDTGVDDPLRKAELNKFVAEREQAVATFFERNLALVHSIAHKQQRAYPTNLEHDELVNNGVPGLLKAIDKFDPSRGNKFSTVATWWIRQAISRGTNAQHRIIRLPEHQIQKLIEMNRLAADSGMSMTDSDFPTKVREALGLDQSDIEMITNAANCGSLDRVIGSSDGTPWTLMNVAEETHRAPAAEDSVLDNETHRIFEDALSSLPEDQRVVICSQFRIPDDEGAVLKPKEVRTKLGITQTKLKSLAEAALTNLRGYFDSEGYEFADMVRD